MATLTIKNMPDELYAALSELAKRHRRSINSEAIVQLERTVQVQRRDAEDIIREAREIRARNPKMWLTDEILEKAKNEGRP